MIINMKKKFLLSLFLLGTATTVISYPVPSFAAPDESISDSEESIPEGEASEEAVETDEEGNPVAGEEIIVEESTVDPYANAYFVIVTAEEGTMLYQEASPESSLSINIPIPKNTVLHILKEETDSAGTTWGYISYSDLKDGYVKLTDLSFIQAKTAKEVVEEKFDGNWGHDFVKVNGSGTPVSFNSLSKEELESAEESNAEESRKGKKDAKETTAAPETNADGSPVVEVFMETDENGDPIPLETDENGNPIVYETDEDGNPIIPETEPETEAEEKKSGGFSIISFLIGFVSVILLEAIVAGLMIVLRRIKLKKRAKAEAQESAPQDEEGGEKKKKGLKIKLPKISLPKIKLPKIGKKKKKKGEEAEE